MRITLTTGDRHMVKVVIRQDDGKERVVGHYDPRYSIPIRYTETLQTFHAEVERLGIGRESFQRAKRQRLAVCSSNRNGGTEKVSGYGSSILRLWQVSSHQAI